MADDGLAREEMVQVLVPTSAKQVVVAVILFDGKEWMLRTIDPPESEMMRDLKHGLKRLVEQFTATGF